MNVEESIRKFLYIKSGMTSYLDLGRSQCQNCKCMALRVLLHVDYYVHALGVDGVCNVLEGLAMHVDKVLALGSDLSPVRRRQQG